MLPPPSLPALRARYLADTAPGSRGATPALAGALEAIGWRAVGEPSAADLADHLLWLLDDCVHQHRDVEALVTGIARMLRDAGPLLDGGLPPVEAYAPAATEVLVRYVAADGAHDRSRNGSDDGSDDGSRY